MSASSVTLSAASWAFLHWLAPVAQGVGKRILLELLAVLSEFVVVRSASGRRQPQKSVSPSITVFQMHMCSGRLSMDRKHARRLDEHDEGMELMMLDLCARRLLNSRAVLQVVEQRNSKNEVT